MVIGGGIAGMEAARVVAIRGHRVTLYEKKGSLGGHLIEAAVPDFKRDLATLLYWYQRQLKNLDVEVKLGTEVSEVLISKESPEVVIIATGSMPAIPDIPGVDRDSVITCIDLLLGKKKAGQKVAVIGGGLVGCETALWLAKEGKEVTIVEMLPELMAGSLPVPQMNRMMLLDLLALSKVNLITGARVQEISGEGVIAVKDSIPISIKAGYHAQFSPQA